MMTDDVGAKNRFEGNFRVDQLLSTRKYLANIFHYVLNSIFNACEDNQSNMQYDGKTINLGLYKLLLS